LRLRHRWGDNIEMNLKGIGSMGVYLFMWLKICSSGELLCSR